MPLACSTNFFKKKETKPPKTELSTNPPSDSASRKKRKVSVDRHHKKNVMQLLMPAELTSA